MSNFAVERMDHLGIVAGVCQKMGLVEYFDGLDEQTHARVSLGQAVLAMVLNGLGFRNYLKTVKRTYRRYQMSMQASLIRRGNWMLS